MRGELSLFPALERILKLYPALKMFFLSLDKPPILLQNFFEDDLFIRSLLLVVLAFFDANFSLQNRRSTKRDDIYFRNHILHQEISSRKTSSAEIIKIPHHTF